MTPRSEPLLWLQLIGLAAMPLELLLALLLLAGSDPGPWPGLERVVIWSLGAVAPAVLLWRQPPDPLSLLLFTAPRLRRPAQLALTNQQVSLPLKLVLASGAALLLPALWWLDTSSVLAHAFALLPDSSRLLALLAVVPVLALLVWQWQQLVQAISLLVGNGELETTSNHQQPAPRLDLGLPWLQLPELEQEAQPTALAAPPSSVPAVSEAEEPPGLDHGPGVAVATEGSPQEGAPLADRDAAEVQDATEVQAAPAGESESVSEPETAAENAPERNEAELNAPELNAPELNAAELNESELNELELNEPATWPGSSPSLAESFGEPEITDVAFTPVDDVEPMDSGAEASAGFSAAPQDDSAAVAIEPEQAAEEDQGPSLDEPVG